MELYYIVSIARKMRLLTNIGKSAFGQTFNPRSRSMQIARNFIWLWQAASKTVIVMEIRLSFEVNCNLRNRLMHSRTK